jgi:hypothetical protein
MPGVRDGVLKGDLPCLSVGEGAPLDVFPRSAPSHANPTGFKRPMAALFLAPLARGFAVCSLNRKVGLRPNAMMADTAANYAEALEASFGGSVGVLGISTSGSVVSSSPRTITGFCAGWCSLGPPTGWVRSLRGLNGAGRRSRSRGTTGRSLAAAAPTLGESRAA